MSAKHETRDADVGSLFLILSMLFISGTLICLAIAGMVRFLSAKQQAIATNQRAAAPVTKFPEPRLEARPHLELENVRLEEESRLKSYGWVDRNADIVHIPIDRAMELLLERGLPDVGGGQTPLQLMQARPEQDQK